MVVHEFSYLDHQLLSIFPQFHHLRGRNALPFFPLSIPFIIVGKGMAELSYDFKIKPLDWLFCFSPVYLYVVIRNANGTSRGTGVDSFLPQTCISCAEAIGCQGPSWSPVMSLSPKTCWRVCIYTKAGSGDPIHSEDVIYPPSYLLTEISSSRRSCLAGACLPLHKIMLWLLFLGWVPRSITQQKEEQSIALHH